MLIIKKVVKILIINILLAINLKGQAPESFSTSDILFQLNKLGNTGRILYVAAHPDDENTSLITYLTHEKGYHTGYISLTRGGGGQNRIGPEIKNKLGLIRTHELLAAREKDKGIQFFSRARDFGYSKTADETFNIWNKEKVLADLVWTIRTFKPDVIINRFSTEPGRTHGHHTASAKLSIEAFKAASNPERFKNQLKYTNTWKPKRILFNTSWWFYGSKKAFEPHKDEFLQIDIGKFNAPKGKSYTEIGAEARSMHKSQGFGKAGSRGKSIEYFEGVKGKLPKNEIMKNISTDFSRLKKGKKIRKLIKRAKTKFNPEKPAKIVPVLVDILEILKSNQSGNNQYIINQKVKEVKKLIKACTGLYVEAHSDQRQAVAGDSLQLHIEIVNRSSIPLYIKNIRLPFANQSLTLNKKLSYNKVLKKSIRLKSDDSINITHPYWLKKEPGKGMFKVEGQKMVNKPLSSSPVNIHYNFSINNTNLHYSQPFIYKKEHPVKGIIYKPFEITPPVMANLKNKSFVFAGNKPKTLSIELHAGKENIEGTCSLKLPEGWKSEPGSTDYKIKLKGASQQIDFKIFPPKNAGKGEFTVNLSYNGKNYSRGISRINYDHIPSLMMFPESRGQVLKLNIEKKGKNIGYVMGAGDEIPMYLRQIGYNVTILKTEEIKPQNLKKYDAIIMGIRAYNTLPELKYYQDNLMDYVKNGGTMIVQYSKSHNLLFKDIGPYPIQLSHDRITDEKAKMEMLKPDHSVFNYPNKIRKKDFNNWVQERGLYFANEWDDQYQPLLSGHDPDEKKTTGSLLVAKYGEGHYIYTGLAFFRQLPAGVSGAYRLFANLIALDN